MSQFISIEVNERMRWRYFSLVKRDLSELLYCTNEKLQFDFKLLLQIRYNLKNNYIMLYVLNIYEIYHFYFRKKNDELKTNNITYKVYTSLTI